MYAISVAARALRVAKVGTYRLAIECHDFCDNAHVKLEGVAPFLDLPNPILWQPVWLPQFCYCFMQLLGKSESVSNKRG